MHDVCDIVEFRQHLEGARYVRKGGGCNSAVRIKESNGVIATLYVMGNGANCVQR